MRIEWKEYNIKGEKIMAKVSIDEKGDQKLIKKLYSDWKILNDKLKKLVQEELICLKQ